MILKLAWKNTWFKPLNTLLSIILLAASISIITVLLLLQKQFEEKFSSNIDNIDLVIGAQGSPLQLILSSVYQIDNPTGNIAYQEAKNWINHPFVERAVPLAFGDNYKGYRIVGTTQAYLLQYNLQIAQGKTFVNDFEVIIGSEIAQNLNLKIGDTFFGSHGDAAEGEVHDHQKYTIVGIFKPSGKVADNLILSTIKSVWLMHHPEEEITEETLATTEEHIHDENCTHHPEEEATEEEHVHDEHCTHDHHEEVSINEDEQEITAILIKFKNKMGVVTWPRIIAQNTKMQAVSPVYEVNRLFELFGIGLDALKYLAFGIMLLSGISIFISLYNRLNERKYEFALMRINGAKPLHLFGLVLTESLLLCVLGYAFGKVIGRLALYFISNSSQQNYKMSFDIFATDFKNEFLLFIITLGVGVLAALIPAIKAYTLNISKTLSHA